MADIPMVCNIGSAITGGIQAAALVVSTAVGGYFAFLIIRKALRWSSCAMGTAAISSQSDYVTYRTFTDSQGGKRLVAHHPGDKFRVARDDGEWDDMNDDDWGWINKDDVTQER